MCKVNKFNALIGMPTKALMTDSDVIDDILEGINSYEVRSHDNYQPECIALIKKESSQITAVANLVKIQKTLGNRNKFHIIYCNNLPIKNLWCSDNWVRVWVLENVLSLDKPIAFPGTSSIANEWVNLDISTQKQLSTVLGASKSVPSQGNSIT
jgi:hypothetical protein